MEVLKALQELKVFWKKIGHYNMKCRYTPGRREGIFNNSMHDNNYFGDESPIIENDGNITPQNVVKFELQVINFICIFIIGLLVIIYLSPWLMIPIILFFGII